jgi:hypothetical protein
MSKKLGFCFLIYGKIHYEELWYNWFKHVDKSKYAIYIHYKTNVKLDYFEEYKLDHCIDTKYCDVSIIHAHNLLFKQAYDDGCTKIISLSQACIPLKTFDHVYTFLTKDDLAHFSISSKQRGVFPRCDRATRGYCKEHIQKSSNWIILNRNIARVAITNTRDYIDQYWKGIYAPEEHYFITEVFKHGLTAEIKTTNWSSASGATTFTNWHDSDYLYPYYHGLKNYSQIILEEIEYLVNQPCLFGRKFNPGCMVICNTSNESSPPKKVCLASYLMKLAIPNSQTSTRNATFSGHWVSNKHTNVVARQHLDNNDLIIYAVYDDGWTKMVGLTKSGERVDGRYLQGNVTLDATSVIKAWDSPSGKNVGKAYYTVDCS